MSDTCGPVEIDEHNVTDPTCDYAPSCKCEKGWQCDFCRQFARGYNGRDVVQISPERSVLSKGIAHMVDPCPRCDRGVYGEQGVARPRASDPWWHESCFDAAIEDRA